MWPSRGRDSGCAFFALAFTLLEINEDWLKQHAAKDEPYWA